MEFGLGVGARVTGAARAWDTARVRGGVGARVRGGVGVAQRT